MVELGNLKPDTLGEVSYLVEIDAVGRNRNAGEQHRFGARSPEIGGDRSEARLESCAVRPDLLVLVHGLTTFARRI